MSRATNTDSRGRFCGRAVHGVSNLSAEDFRQIEAHRAKERPTPWAHLAMRYGVNEIDLRRLVEGSNDNEPAARPVPIQASPLSQREQRFKTMWLAGVPKSEIMLSLCISHGTADRMRVILGLPKRAAGRRPNDWTDAEDEYIRQHYTREGQTALEVAKALGRTRLAVIGRANRIGALRLRPRPEGLKAEKSA